MSSIQAQTASDGGESLRLTEMWALKEAYMLLERRLEKEAERVDPAAAVQRGRALRPRHNAQGQPLTKGQARQLRRQLDSHFSSLSEEYARLLRAKKLAKVTREGMADPSWTRRETARRLRFARGQYEHERWISELNRYADGSCLHTEMEKGTERLVEKLLETVTG
ncbi:Hypothetical protein D9617_1g086080 [Elsinoe fawcettii]|nr:Hypothetical protein D9617_1g086080 [Elsinoe fawcettii]